MTTPGSGDQPQNPGQGWGQQPPSGPDQPGQTPPSGQQWSAPEGQQPGQPQQYDQPGQPQQFGQPGQPQQFGQPGQPGQQPWGAPGAQPEPKKKSAAARILPIVAGAVAVIVVGFVVRGVLGGGAPEVGDCVKASGSDGYEVVDCDSSDAQYRIFGTDDDMTEAEFYADADTCLDAATSANITDGRSLWYGTSGDEGKVFCAETL